MEQRKIPRSQPLCPRDMDRESSRMCQVVAQRASARALKDGSAGIDPGEQLTKRGELVGPTPPLREWQETKKPLVTI